MKEISVNPTYIRVVTFIENFLGKKLYYTHCIPLNNPKEMNKGMSDLIDFCNKHVPSFLSVELVNGEIKTTK